MSRPPAAARRLTLHAGLAALLAPGAGLRAQGAVELAWDMLNENQRTILAPFQRQWGDWPPEERAVWVRLADNLPQLDAGQRERAYERIRQWARLSPDERQVARRNFSLARSLDREERIREWQRYNSLTAEQRSILRAHPQLADPRGSPLPSATAQPLTTIRRNGR